MEIANKTQCRDIEDYAVEIDLMMNGRTLCRCFWFVRKANQKKNNTHSNLLYGVLGLLNRLQLRRLYDQGP